MAANEHRGVENQQAVLASIDAAAALLDQRADIPKSFVIGLFARAVPEDFLPCQPQEVAALAERAWSLLAIRQPGTPKIRFESPAAAATGDRLKDISVLEVVNDDMPFLVDSVMAELAERGVDVRLVVHPVFAVARDPQGRLVDFKAVPVPGSARESFIHIHVGRIDDDAQRGAIVAALEQVLADIRLCVQDWRPMMGRLGEIIADLKISPPPLAPEEIAEAAAFLEWLVANNFTFLGIRHYRVSDDGNVLEPQFETGLGLLRERERRVVWRGDQLVTITPAIREFLNEPRLLFVTKSALRSRVHRRVDMDHVVVKRFRCRRPAGRRASSIVGLFTSTAYVRSTRSIPYLRRKVAAVMSRAGFDPDEPFRQGPRQHARNLSARRAVPDR